MIDLFLEPSPAVSGKIGLLVPTAEDEFYEQNPEERI
jgi:hypothetical protein